LLEASDPSKKLSSKEVKTLVRSLCAGLRAHGVQKSDRIVSIARPSIYFYPFFYGCIGVGAQFTAGQTGWTSLEIQKTVTALDATYLVVESIFLVKVLEAAEAMSFDTSKIIVFDTDDEATVLEHEGVRFHTWRSLLQHGEADWDRLSGYEVTKSTTALIIFTSGTSGVAKGVRFSHYKLIAHINHWDKLFGNPDYKVSAPLQILTRSS